MSNNIRTELDYPEREKNDPQFTAEVRFLIIALPFVTLAIFFSILLIILNADKIDHTASRLVSDLFYGTRKQQILICSGMVGSIGLAFFLLRLLKNLKF